MVGRWFAARPADKTVEALLAHDIPHSPIMSMADVFADPHYRAREMIVDVPAKGLGTLPQPGVVPKLSRTPGRITHAGRALARYGRDLVWRVGLTPEEIAALRSEGVG
jgi:crotonobetainyl-CoA:carnitine CoA-transferase CaiB-like acyl-CoA transferase